jgi:predicted nucleic acid-binding protein
VKSKGYLLDTNILSETRKLRPDERVTGFLRSANPSSLYVSVLTIGELYKGIEIKRRVDPDAASRIGAWVEGIEAGFADRILAVTPTIARRWGQISADRSRPVIDTLIAATALMHELTLVTRNGGDIQGIEVAIFDPWN